MNQYAWYVAIAFAIAAAGALAGWHERVLREPALLDAQQAADNKQCQNNQQITKEANDALQKNNAAIAARLSALQLQYPNNTVSVAGKPVVASGGQGGHAGQNGTVTGSTSDFRAYAAECNSYRSTLMVCEQNDLNLHKGVKP